MRRVLAGIFVVALSAGVALGQASPFNYIVPTAPSGNSSNRTASTAFVQSAIAAMTTTCPANQWVDAIAPTTITCAQPAFSNISGVAAPAQIGAGAASHAVPVDVAGTPTWKVVPDCQDSTGKHINYTQSTDSFSCGTSASSTTPNFVYAYYSTSLAQWVYQQVDGTVITAASNTCQLQEAWNYAVANNYSLIYLGNGRQCSVAANTTLTFTATYNSSFFGRGLNFKFTNTAQNGVHIDTQRYGHFDCAGCVWYYTGTANAILIQPALGPAGISCTVNSTACWAIDETYDLGTIFIQGGPAAVGIAVDIGAANGASQLLSSTFGNNIVRFNAIECQGNSQYGFRYITGTNSFQAGGENQYIFNNIEGCTTAEMLLGSSGGSANDVNLGTNFYQGNIAHTVSTAGTFGIITDVSLDRFKLTSLNAYAGGPVTAVFWGPNAASDLIQSSQVNGWSALEGGTGQTFALNNWFSAAPWRPFTPTLGCTGGTVTASTPVGHAKRVDPPLGKAILYTLDLTLTTLTGCSTAGGSQLTATVPWTQTSATGSVSNGREVAASGLIYTGTLAAGGTNVAITGASNACTDCVSGRHIVMSGSSEAQ